MKRRTLIIMHRHQLIVGHFEGYFSKDHEVLGIWIPKLKVLAGEEGIPPEDVVYVIGMEFGMANPHGNDIADFLLNAGVSAKNIIRISQVDDQQSREINAIFLNVHVPSITWNEVAQEIARRFPEDAA